LEATRERLGDEGSAAARVGAEAKPVEEVVAEAIASAAPARQE
jgi:hypothetical protein